MSTKAVRQFSRLECILSSEKRKLLDAVKKQHKRGIREIYFSTLVDFLASTSIPSDFLCGSQTHLLPAPKHIDPYFLIPIPPPDVYIAPPSPTFEPDTENPTRFTYYKDSLYPTRQEYLASLDYGHQKPLTLPAIQMPPCILHHVGSQDSCN